MPKPDFEKMALEIVSAHFSAYPNPLQESLQRTLDGLEQAYAAGRADERERCAKMADTADVMKCGYSGDGWAHGFGDAQEYITQLIRQGDDK